MKTNKVNFLNSMSNCFDLLNIKDGMTLSFHHHLRNGDGVLNKVIEEIKRRDLKTLQSQQALFFLFI